MEIFEATILAIVTYSYVRIITAEKNKVSCILLIIAGLVEPKDTPKGNIRMDKKVNILSLKKYPL
jgi:hypothetical protein